MEYNSYKIEKSETKYLIFEKHKQPNMKTFKVLIYNKSDEPLAYIKFKNTWRTYIVYFEENAIFDSKCLNDIIYYLNKLNSDRLLK